MNTFFSMPYGTIKYLNRVNSINRKKTRKKRFSLNIYKQRSDLFQLRWTKVLQWKNKIPMKGIAIVGKKKLENADNKFLNIT